MGCRCDWGTGEGLRADWWAGEIGLLMARMLIHSRGAAAVWSLMRLKISLYYAFS